MTQQEKQEQLQRLAEQQLALLAKMSESDAHASKCTKLGLVFADTYPAQHAEYVAAREQYNLNEEEIERIEAIEPEDEHIPEDLDA